MSTSAPAIKSPVTFPARFAWLQHSIRTRVRPYHLAMAAGLGLVTVVFAVVVGVLLLIATNFNLLGAIE